MKVWGRAIAAIIVIVIVYEYSPKVGMGLIALAALGMIASYWGKPKRSKMS